VRRRRGLYDTPPEPQAIDPASGFKVPLRNLVKQWDGEMVDRRFVDRRNPQDFVRGVKDNSAPPFARPEVPDTFIADNILWEDGLPMIGEALAYPATDRRGRAGAMSYDLTLTASEIIDKAFHILGKASEGEAIERAHVFGRKVVAQLPAQDVGSAAAPLDADRRHADVGGRAGRLRVERSVSRCG
jgi:hypothetical protein